MYCVNCGKENPDGQGFCTGCGIKLPESASPVTENEQAAPVESVACEDTVPEAAVTETGNVPEQPQQEYIDPDILNKNRKPGIKPGVIAGIAAAVVVVVGGLFAARGAWMGAIMPKAYVEVAASKTVDTLIGDAQELMKGILGFDLKSDKDYTAVLKMDVDNDFTFEGQLDYLGSKDKLSGKFEADDYEKIEGQFMWDNDKIGLALPDYNDDEYMHIDAKTFGKDFNDSDFADELDVELSDELSASFKEVFGKADLNDSDVKSLKKEVMKATKNFIDSGDNLSKSKEKYEINGKNKNVKVISMDYDGDDLKDLLVAYLEIAKNDEGLIKKLRDIETDGESLEDIIDEGIDAAEDLEIEDFTLRYYLSSNMLLGIKCEFEPEEDVDAYVALMAHNTKNIIDDFTVELKAENDENEQIYSLDFKGNLIPKDNKIDYTVTLLEEYKGESGNDYRYENERSHTANLNNGKFKVDAKYEREYEDDYYDDDKGTYTLAEGKISNKKGFSLIIDEDDYEIEFTLKKGAKYNPIKGMDEYKIFEKSMDDIEDDFDF